MAKMTLKEYLKENHKLNAENPIDYKLLGEIPFFEEVFSGDQELWEIITKLAGAGGIAHIEDKHFKPGENVIEKSNLDQMIMWVLEGSAEVIALQGGKKRVVKRFVKRECFGELTIILSEPRTAEVVAGKEGTRVLEFDWALADRCLEFKALLNELLLKTIAHKLEDTFGVPEKIISGAAKMLHEKDAKNKELQDEIEKLKS